MITKADTVAIPLKTERRKEITPVDTLKKFFMWFVIIWFTIFTLMPMIWLVVSSFKTNTELVSSPFSLPTKWQFQNYINAFQVSGIGKMLLNSLIISIIATVLNMMVASMASFSLSRFQFKMRELVFGTIIIGILIPINALMVPYFTLINKLGIYDKHVGLILTYAAIGLPISTYIIRGFMSGLPVELEEAGIIDGCNFYDRFFKIILPLSRTGIVTAATFQFLFSWNEFIYAMLLTSSQNVRTIQVGIRYFSNQFTTDYTSMYAAIVISIVPSILGYILFQEQIISGLTQGAVKG